MIAQYFIKVVIPLIFAAVMAAFGWFAHEEIGAVIAGVSSLIVSAIWTCYSWMTATGRVGHANTDPRRMVVMTKGKRGRAAYKLKLQN